MLRRNVWFVLVALVVGAACGKVNPPMERDDDGGVMCTVPTQAEACAGKCGELTVCETAFSCGDDCAGELTCGGQTANVCGCAIQPCGIDSFATGDASAQTIVDIALDASGNVLVAGNFRGTITLGTASYTNPGAVRTDMFLVKLSSAGVVLWSKAFGDSTAGLDGDQHVNGIDVDATGNVVLVGFSASTTNLGGAPLAATSDMVIGKFDKDGTHLFSAAYGSDMGFEAYAMAIDPASQDIIVTGKFWGTLKFGSLAAMTAVGTQAYYDIFLVRFAASGTPITSKRYGDDYEQQPEAIATGGSHVYLMAHFGGSYDYGPPSSTTVTAPTDSSYMALAKLTISGFNHAWTKQYGTGSGTSVDQMRIDADATGNIFVSGALDGTLDITSPPYDGTAGDGFLAKLDVNGATVWAKQFANLNILAVTVDAAGTVYTVGYVDGTVDLGGGPVAYNGSADPFIAHYAADGTHLWSRVFAAPVGTLQRATAVAVNADGKIWVGYNFDGMIDLGAGPLTTQGATDIAVVGYVP